MAWKYKLVLLLLCLCPALIAQENGTKEIELRGELSLLEISAYRAKIVLTPGTGKKLKVAYSLYDYDHYNSTGLWKAISQSSAGIQPRFSVESDKILLTTPSTREIVSLNIVVPKGMNVKIVVDHLGLVKAEGLKGELDISAFSGEIELTELSSTVSAYIKRDGDISVSYLEIPKPVYPVLSVYNGQINLRLPQKTAAHFSVSTDLGEITDDFGLSWTKDQPREFELKEAGKSTTKMGYRHQAVLNSPESRVLIRNILGNIYIGPSDR